MNVKITALAEANLEEIYLRIRKDSPGRAVEWREGLLKAAQTLMGRDGARMSRLSPPWHRTRFAWYGQPLLTRKAR